MSDTLLPCLAPREALARYQYLLDNSNDGFEAIGDDFFKSTGFLRPGKSESLAKHYEGREEERREAWNVWIKAQWVSAKSAATAALACFGWRTMDSAPRDGTQVLLVVAASGDMLVAGYDDDASGYPWATLDGPRYGEAFFTHWQHLPSPPGPNIQDKEAEV